MAYKYEAPFVNPEDVSKKQRGVQQQKRKPKKRKKKRVRRKKIKILRYAIDPPNLTSDKLRQSKREREHWDSVQFPVDENGNFITISFVGVIATINKKVGEQYNTSLKNREKPDHQNFITRALNEIGCFDFWSRGRIRSYLSRHAAIKRREKRERETKRVLEEARQAELSLNIPKDG